MDHFRPGHIARVGHLHRGRDGHTLRHGRGVQLQGTDGKVRVTQAEPERKLRRDVELVVVPVARVVIVAEVRIPFRHLRIVHGHGHRQLAARVDVAKQDICNRVAPFHTRVKRVEEALHVVDGLRRGADAPALQDDHNVGVDLGKLLDEQLLDTRQFDASARAVHGAGVVVLPLLRLVESTDEDHDVRGHCCSAGGRKTRGVRAVDRAAWRELYLAGRNLVQHALQRGDGVGRVHPARAEAVQLGDRGTRADHGDRLFHVQRQDVRLILEQDNGLSAGIETQRLVLGRVGPCDGIALWQVVHHARQVFDPQDAPDRAVEVGIVDDAIHVIGGQLLLEGRYVHIHFEIAPGLERLAGVPHRTPVGNYVKREAPSVLQNAVEQVGVFRGLVSVDLVVGVHHRQGACVLDDPTEVVAVVLHQLALRHDVVDIVPVHLLVHRIEVFDRSDDRLALDAAHHFDVHVRRQKGVLPTRLRAPAIARITAQVHGRTELLVLAVGVEFGAHRVADVMGELTVPRRCEADAHRERRRRHKPHTVRSIRHGEPRNGRGRVVRRRPERVAVDLGNLLRPGQLIDLLLNQDFQWILIRCGRGGAGLPEGGQENEHVPHVDQTVTIVVRTIRCLSGEFAGAVVPLGLGHEIRRGDIGAAPLSGIEAEVCRRIGCGERGVVGRKRVGASLAGITVVEADHGQRGISGHVCMADSALRTAGRCRFPSHTQRPCRRSESVVDAAVHEHRRFSSPPRTRLHRVDLPLHFHHGFHGRIGHLHPEGDSVRLGPEPQSHGGQQAEEPKSVQALSNGREACVGRAVSVHAPKLRCPFCPQAFLHESGA